MAGATAEGDVDMQALRASGGCASSRMTGAFALAKSLRRALPLVFGKGRAGWVGRAAGDELQSRGSPALDEVARDRHDCARSNSSDSFGGAWGRRAVRDSAGPEEIDFGGTLTFGAKHSPADATEEQCGDGAGSPEPRDASSETPARSPGCGHTRSSGG